MDIFLSVIDALNNNWIWAGPILAMLALVMAAREVIVVTQDELDRLREYKD